MLIVKSAAKIQQKLHIRKFLSGIFEKSRSSLLLLGIDSRPYACIRGGYIALKERAQPFSKIPLILAYAPQDANVCSKGTPLGEEVEDTTKKAPARFFRPFKPSCHQKSSKVSLLPFMCPFRGVLFRLTSSFAGQWYCPLLHPFPRDFIPLSYFISCPVRVYSFSPRRMKICPSRRSFLASPALTGTFSRDSPNAS